MQRTEDGAIIISCDFTGVDWDERMPMIEGHRGSVLSLDALSRAIAEHAPSESPFECTLCLRPYEAGAPCWSHPDPPCPDSANPEAVICRDCIEQADRAFAQDPDTPWQRQLPPSKRWR